MSRVRLLSLVAQYAEIKPVLFSSHKPPFLDVATCMLISVLTGVL